MRSNAQTRPHPDPPPDGPFGAHGRRTYGGKPRFPSETSFPSKLSHNRLPHNSRTVLELSFTFRGKLGMGVGLTRQTQQ
jgi:hypothetical protein